MNKKVNFYIVRHGRTLMNTLHRVQGWCDSPLTEEGIRSAQYLGVGLKDIPFQAVYCSTLKRTLQTARILLKSKGQEDIPIIEIDGLKEMCFGAMESMDEYQVWERVALALGYYPDLNKISTDLQSGKLSYQQIYRATVQMDTWEMAETWEQVEARSQKALQEIAHIESEKGSENVLVVAHGMSIACMLYGWGGHKFMKDEIQNASVSTVCYQNQQFIVESIGDLSFLEKGKKQTKIILSLFIVKKE